MQGSDLTYYIPMRGLASGVYMYMYMHNCTLYRIASVCTGNIREVVADNA